MDTCFGCWRVVFCRFAAGSLLTVVLFVLHHFLIRLMFLAAGSPVATASITDLSSYENRDVNTVTKVMGGGGGLLGDCQEVLQVLKVPSQ